MWQRSKAEEEERRRAEEERVKAAQAAAEAATQAAAEEAARQAAEQQRLAEEAAVRAQNVAAQKAQAEQARMGPSPEILARIQKELAEVRTQSLILCLLSRHINCFKQIHGSPSGDKLLLSCIVKSRSGAEEWKGKVRMGGGDHELQRLQKFPHIP